MSNPIPGASDTADDNTAAINAWLAKGGGEFRGRYKHIGKLVGPSGCHVIGEDPTTSAFIMPTATESQFSNQTWIYPGTKQADSNIWLRRVGLERPLDVRANPGSGISAVDFVGVTDCGLDACRVIGAPLNGITCCNTVRVHIINGTRIERCGVPGPDTVGVQGAAINGYLDNWDPTFTDVLMLNLECPGLYWPVPGYGGRAERIVVDGYAEAGIDGFPDGFVAYDIKCRNGVRKIASGHGGEITGGNWWLRRFSSKRSDGAGLFLFDPKGVRLDDIEIEDANLGDPAKRVMSGDIIVAMTNSAGGTRSLSMNNVRCNSQLSEHAISVVDYTEKKNGRLDLDASDLNLGKAWTKSAVGTYPKGALNGVLG